MEVESGGEASIDLKADYSTRHSSSGGGGEGGSHGVGGNIARALVIVGVADVDVGLDVQDTFLAARRQYCGDEVELISVSVVSTCSTV